MVAASPSAQRSWHASKENVRPGAVAAFPRVRTAGARPGLPVLDDRAVAPRVRVLPGKWTAVLGVAPSTGADTHLRRSPLLAATARHGGTTTGQGRRAPLARWHVPGGVARTDGGRAGAGGTGMVPGVDPGSVPRRARRLCPDARGLPPASFRPCHTAAPRSSPTSPWRDSSIRRPPRRGDRPDGETSPTPAPWLS